MSAAREPLDLHAQLVADLDAMTADRDALKSDNVNMLRVLRKVEVYLANAPGLLLDVRAALLGV